MSGRPRHPAGLWVGFVVASAVLSAASPAAIPANAAEVPLAASIEVTPATASAFEHITLHADVTGGRAPYVYRWSGWEDGPLGCSTATPTAAETRLECSNLLDEHDPQARGDLTVTDATGAVVTVTGFEVAIDVQARVTASLHVDEIGPVPFLDFDAGGISVWGEVVSPDCGPLCLAGVPLVLEVRYDGDATWTRLRRAAPDYGDDGYYDARYVSILRPGVVRARVPGRAHNHEASSQQVRVTAQPVFTVARIRGRHPVTRLDTFERDPIAGIRLSLQRVRGDRWVDVRSMRSGERAVAWPALTPAQLRFDWRVVSRATHGYRAAWAFLGR